MSDPRDRWLLPAGIEEILPPQAARIESTRRALIDLFHTWGYELVMPPLIEYLESLLTGTGPDLDLQTFKLIDQLTGRLMGVRADMTPQVARIDAHHLQRDEPVRLCYLGTVLHTRPDGFSGARSPIQVGAELYGHSGAHSDCEIIALMLETLETAGVRDVHLDIGHLGIFRSLVQAASLGDAQESVLFDALQRKARAEIEGLLAEAGVAAELRDMLLALVSLNGGDEVLRDAGMVLEPANDQVHRALDHLKALAEEMMIRAPHIPLHFDLAELRGYRYERGVVFAAFVPGHGQEIARGGRYDGIGEAFGRVRPAIGFSTDLKTLVGIGDRGPTWTSGAIFAPASGDEALRRQIKALRERGERVVVELPGQDGDAQSMGCDRLLVQHGSEWVVRAGHA